MGDDRNELRFEHAPQEKILFVERLADVFLERVLGIEEALVSDESWLWDFRDFFSYDIEDALRPGSKPGYYVFHKKKSIRGKTTPSSPEELLRRFKDIPDEEIEAEPTCFRRDVTQKTREVFGVDISSVFDKYLPEILHYILANMPESKRTEFSEVFRK